MLEIVWGRFGEVFWQAWWRFGGDSWKFWGRFGDVLREVAEKCCFGQLLGKLWDVFWEVVERFGKDNNYKQPIAHQFQKI